MSIGCNSDLLLHTSQASSFAHVFLFCGDGFDMFDRWLRIYRNYARAGGSAGKYGVLPCPEPCDSHHIV